MRDCALYMCSLRTSQRAQSLSVGSTFVTSWHLGRMGRGGGAYSEFLWTGITKEHFLKKKLESGLQCAWDAAVHRGFCRKCL